MPAFFVSIPVVRAKLYRPTDRNISFLARKLRQGEIVAVPTETVYGLAANALDSAACRKIFEAKGRPASDPLIVHLLSAAQLPVVCVPNSAAEKLAKAFWPGPLTLILPKRAAVPGIVTAGRHSVAVRVPRNRLFRRLLSRAKLPLAAPSANPFGYISPTTAQHVLANLGEKIPYILEGGASTIGLESTIVDIRDPSRPQLLRPGAVSLEDLESVLRCRVKVLKRKLNNTKTGALAPGQLTRHYSPKTPIFTTRNLGPVKDPTVAYLFIQKPRRKCGKNEFWLDATGNLQRSAKALFATLRKIDESGFAAIYAELAKESDGFGLALNDRLTRAAAK